MYLLVVVMMIKQKAETDHISILGLMSGYIWWR